jgi:hypothetical protein
MDPNTTPRRRFALVMGWILFLYVNAGIQFDSPAQMNILGIQVLLRHTLDWGLFLTTAYALARYGYYDVICNIPPWRARRLLKKGILPEGLPGKMAPGREVEDIIKKSFPGIMIGAKKKAGECAYEFSVDPMFPTIFEIGTISHKTRIACWLENLDYAFPILVAGTALAWPLLVIIKIWLVSTVSNL